MNGPVRLPYPGLRPFRREEADLFFGRESSVDEMVSRLAKTRFLAVLGPSGSGKSSLVRTGLLDALELGLMAGAGPRWLIADMRPGARPIENLGRALLALPGAGDGGSAAQEEPAGFARRLRRGPRSLIEWCTEGHLPARANLLLLVDQFEELFRYADLAGRDEAEAFVSLLINSAEAADLPIYVVLTMRSEFLGPSALIPDLAERINEGLYLTRRMTRDEMREAIVGPAVVCGFTIEPVLVNTLLNDLASFAPWEGERGVEQFQLLARRADQLPLLQHVLNRLWLCAREADPVAPIVLSLDAYEALGGLAGALDAHAEEVLATIPTEHRGSAEPVFRALVSGSSIATAVRRPCRISELVALACGRSDAVARVVEAFRDPGCNFLVASPAGALEPETTVDISHESLIRQWKRLSEWLNAEAKAAEEYRYLEETASRWEKRQSGLLRMPYLAAALAWRARESPSEAWAKRYGGNFTLAMRFLEQSGRRQRVRRQSGIGVGVLAGLMVVIGLPILVHQQLALGRLQAATQADNAGISDLNGQGGHKDYAAAIKSFQKAVALGSVDAAYQMGRVYEYGYGVVPDDKKAAEWYRMAAGKGHASAEFYLGYFYDEGRGTKQDFGQAMFWYREAALQGNAAAENNIGYLYDHGRGVKADPKQAMQWYQRSAEAGDGAAASNIGWLYQHGVGVPRDYGKAMTWFFKSASENWADGAADLGYLYEAGLGVQADPGAALVWYLKAANDGSAYGAFNVGRFYEHGIAVAKDYDRAMAWYRKAAAAGSVSAEDNIGYFYENGFGVRRDYAEAMRWFRKSAAGGNAQAMNGIGWLYQHGAGVTRDDAEAMAWYRKAAEAGSSTGAFNVGFLYAHGIGVGRDVKTAMHWFRESAEVGDVDAAFELGYLYKNGAGIKPDPAQAMRWYLKAANEGDSDAALEVGYFYANAIGVAKNDAEAMTWYKKSAAGGNSTAENNIGFLYEYGRGVKQDYFEAMYWYRQAAEAGNHLAESNIGHLYEHGLGVKQDYAKAAEWYRKAALGGNVRAEYDLGSLYEFGQGVPLDPATAVSWYLKAAEAGDVHAELRVGYFYDEGLGVHQDHAKALEWYKKSAVGGDSTAAYNIGLLFQYGRGVPRDYAEAMRWYRQAAGADNEGAEVNIGYLYAHGLGVAQDYRMAMTWYRKAAASGDALADNNIGSLYESGHGVTQDDAKAAEWYRKAALGGNVDGEYNLGDLYATGKGVPQDDAQAKAWFGKAAAQGDADAARRIGEILSAEGTLDQARTWLTRSVQLAQATLAKNASDPDAMRTIRLAAGAIGNISGHLLMMGAFAKALNAADSSIALAPDLVWLQINRADALMMLGQTDAARTIYLRYQAIANDGAGGGKSWKQDVVADFAELRTHGFTSPLMTEIEGDFQD